VRPSKPSMKETCSEGRLDSSQACDVLTDLCRNEYSSGCRAADRGRWASGGCTIPGQQIPSCCDDTVRSKSFDIAHGRLAKAVFSVELADALVPDFVSGARGVQPIHKHPLPGPLEPQLLLVLKRVHPSMREIDDEALKLPSVRHRLAPPCANASHSCLSAK